jgi:hypothetical protein
VFYIGALLPVARILSRLLEEAPFAKIFQGVYLYISYILLPIFPPEDGQQEPKHVTKYNKKYKVNTL